MNNLPDSTNIYKPLPKELFYKYLNSAGTLKKTFMDEIDSIIWTNTLSPETMTIRPGKYVPEIAIVEIVAKRQAVTQNLLEMLNRETNQYTIFVVRYEEWGQIWCCDQAVGTNPNEPFICDGYFQTSWFPYDDLAMNIVGQDLDQVYANIFYQITGKSLSLKKNTPAIAASAAGSAENSERSEEVILTEKIKDLEAAIKQLETKIDHEKQFNRQLKLTEELLTIRAEIKKIRSPRMTHMEVLQPLKNEPSRNPSESARSLFPNVFLNMKNSAGNRFDYKIY